VTSNVIQVCLSLPRMVRRLHKGMVVFPDTRAGRLDPLFLVKAVLPANLACHVQREHQLRAVLLFLAPALREASHLPAGPLVSRRLPADPRKATRAIRLLPATAPRQLRLALPLPLQALVPYPWIPLSYPVHLRWSKSRCSAR
jgi:hypothetical protein